MKPMKAIKELKVGDIVCVSDPDGHARITRKERSRLFHASGGCWAMDLLITKGPNKGKTITDQHHPGDDHVEVPEAEVRETVET